MMVMTMMIFGEIMRCLLFEGRACFAGGGLPVLNEEGNLIKDNSEKDHWVSNSPANSEVYSQILFL